MTTSFPELEERYRIEERFEGGQAIVLRCVDLETNEVVAVRTANETTSADPARLERFVTSLRTLLEIDHPNVVRAIRFHEPGELGDRAFLVTEWIDQTLDERMSRGDIEFGQALEMVQKILSGLSAIHQSGVIHRDLRPVNIYVSEDGQRVCIGDLGGDEGTLGNSTKYTAPEAYDEYAVVDARSDIYSAGLVAYELLAGTERFQEQFPEIYGAEEERVRLSRWINWHRDPSRIAPPLTEVDSGIPQSISDAVAQMLAKNPSDRFYDTDLALSSVRGTASGSAAASSAIPVLKLDKDAEDTESTKGSVKSWWYAAAAVVVIALVGVGGLWFTSQNSGNLIRAANEAMDAMEKARTEALAANAPELAPEPMSVGDEERTNGHGAYQEKEWGTATGYYKEARADFLEAARLARSAKFVTVGGRKYRVGEDGQIEIDGQHYQVDEDGQLVQVDPETGEVLAEAGLVKIGDKTFRVGEDGSLEEVDPETGEPLGTATVLLGSNEEEIEAALALCLEFETFCERSFYESETPRDYAPVALAVDSHEVTNAQFGAFVDETGYVTDAEKKGYAMRWAGFASIPVRGRSWRAPGEKGSSYLDRLEHPVRVISWNDANAYCEWSGGRLPSENEWEFAARGVARRIFPWGNEWDPSAALWRGSDEIETDTVGSHPAGATPEGIQDLAGGVWEWTGSAESGDFVLKGGSFDETSPANLRAAARRLGHQDEAHVDDGFRCVADVAENP